MLVHERRERELTQLLFQIGGGMQGEEEVRVNEYKYVHRRYTQTYTQSLYSGSIALQLLILLLLLPSRAFARVAAAPFLFRRFGFCLVLRRRSRGCGIRRRPACPIRNKRRFPEVIRNPLRLHPLHEPCAVQHPEQERQQHR